APRYTLSPEDPGDAWFYTTLRSNTPYQININTDQKLKITRVWLNTTVFDGDRAIGLTGASIDLSSFLQTFTGERQAGITPIIFDDDGVIQAHPDTRRIAFNVALGDADASTSIFSMVEATPR